MCRIYSTVHKEDEAVFIREIMEVDFMISTSYILPSENMMILAESEVISGGGQRLCVILL